MDPVNEGPRETRAAESIDTETCIFALEDDSGLMLAENGQPIATVATTDGEREIVSLKPSYFGGAR